MRGGHVALGGLGKFADLAQGGNARAKGQGTGFAGFDAGLRVQRGHRGRDPVGWNFGRAKGGFGQIAAKAVFGGLAEHMAFMAVDDGEAIAEQKLAFTLAIGAGQQVGEGVDQLGGFAFGKQGRIHGAAQDFEGGAGVGGGYAGVCHRFRTCGNAASNARAPWPTPPLGRAGASEGVWP